MNAMSASHNAAALIRPACRAPVCRSKVERLMTLSTSAVAVCCCSASVAPPCALHFFEQARVLDGDHGLGGEMS